MAPTLPAAWLQLQYSAAHVCISRNTTPFYRRCNSEGEAIGSEQSPQKSEETGKGNMFGNMRSIPPAGDLSNAPAMVEKWQAGPPEGKAWIWYNWHCWGRSEIMVMALHFGGVDYEFIPYTNAEERYMYSHGADVFSMQIDGKVMTDWLESTRYVALTRGLYVDTADVEAICAFEDLYNRCEKNVFNRMVESHYMKQNLKGGRPSRPPSDDDIDSHRKIIGAGVRSTYMKIESLLQEDSRFLFCGKLTVLDLIVCHYRWLIERPEFWCTCYITRGDEEVKVTLQELFEGDEFPKFKKYYEQHMASDFGTYVATRRGSVGDPNAELSKAYVDMENESGGTSYHSCPQEFPFVW